jgi:predicted nucleic acid-binding Zn ribbon protein
MITNNITEHRHCLECGEKIVGRVDKKFCSDQCRNTYNNKLNSDANNTVRNINNVLRKNRRILAELSGQLEKAMVSKETLLSKGFNLTYHTHTYTTKKGDTYRFCYEQGYLFLEDKNLYLLVTHKEKGYETV